MAVAMVAISLLAVTTLAAQQPTHADSTAFVTVLGRDTVAVERVITWPDSIKGEVVARAIAPGRWSYAARLDAAREVVWHRTTYPPPISDTHPWIITVAFRRDTAHMTMRRGDSIRTRNVVVPSGTIPLREPAVGLDQVVVDRARAARGRPVPFAWYYGPKRIEPATAIARANGDTVLLVDRKDTVRAVVDARGRTTRLTDRARTPRVTVSRIAWPDLDRWTSRLMAHDGPRAAMGEVSPRDTVRARVDHEKVLIDYGRPAMRGRRIYGEVIPWNAVWRTGSNAATTLVVDKDMVIGGTRIPAGRYTLFSTLSPGEWTLIINKRTGEWGTDYDPTADLARIPMQVSSGTDRAERFTITIEPTSARSTSSAMLSLSWDTVVARVPIRLAAPST